MHPAWASERAVVRTFFDKQVSAGTRERAGARRGVSHRRRRPLRSRDTGSCREMIARSDLPHLCFKEKPMTAYLISLALAGLLAIVMWEAFE